MAPSGIFHPPPTPSVSGHEEEYVGSGLIEAPVKYPTPSDRRLPLALSWIWSSTSSVIATVFLVSQALTNTHAARPSGNPVGKLWPDPSFFTVTVSAANVSVAGMETDAGAVTDKVSALRTRSHEKRSCCVVPPVTVPAVSYRA